MNGAGWMMKGHWMAVGWCMCFRLGIRGRCLFGLEKTGSFGIIY
jgi:hypothetical protein